MSQQPANRLNFLCFGAGAIGTYLGGSLAAAGHRVVFLERPEMVDPLRSQGLKIHPYREETRYIAAPDVVGALDEALTHGPFDAAILAVKSFDTPALVEGMSPYRVALPPVICFQNGVDNEPLLRGVLGEDKVIPATVTTAVGRGGPGVVAVERLRGIGLWSGHFLSSTLAAVMDSAGLHAHLYENALAMKWSKLLTNLPANASSAILNMTPAEIFAHPGLFRMEIEQLRECLRVMKALQLPVIDLPGTPVRALAWAAGSLPPAISRPLMRRALGAGRGGKMPSFHIDLRGGRKSSEVGFLNGAVVRFGEQVEVPTPVNRLLTRTLTALVDGTLPLDRFSGQPADFLDQLAASRA